MTSALRLTVLRLLMATSIGFGAYIGSAAVAAPARADDHVPATMVGERFSVYGDVAECASGVISVDASGLAVGPYPGTFEESGSVTLGSDPPLGWFHPHLGEPMFNLADAELSFSAESPIAHIEGTKSLISGYGSCYAADSSTPAGDPVGDNLCRGLGSDFVASRSTVIFAVGQAAYEATITLSATGESYTASGTASFYVDRYSIECKNAVTGEPSPTSYGLGSFSEYFITSNVVPAIGPPANVSVTPAAATNVVGQQHCVTATATDASGNPTEDGTIYFTVTGTTTERDTSAGSAVTNSDGEAEFCYTAQFPGSDTITAVADADDDGSPELTEPTGTATKTYVLPVSTPLCQVTIADGGWIIAANHDRASFGGVAKVKDGETRGQQVYQDHGPAETFTVESTSVLAVVCSGTEATIYGTATVDGTGQIFFRIQVSDLSKNGKTDRYGILLSNGYYSGDMVLGGGNIIIKRS